MATVKDAIATMAKNIEITTGKPVEKWVAMARTKGFAKHGEALKWFKDAHGIGHGYANFLAKETLKPDDAGDAALVDAQFAGAKSALKPLYERLVKMVRAFGSDVEVAPKKNNVSVRRNKQFALLQPSTATRMDVGLILKGVPAKGRLEASGSFNAMFTHRVRVESVKDIDGELERWLKNAYDLA